MLAQLQRAHLSLTGVWWGCAQPTFDPNKLFDFADNAILEAMSPGALLQEMTPWAHTRLSVISYLKTSETSLLS